MHGARVSISPGALLKRNLMTSILIALIITQIYMLNNDEKVVKKTEYIYQEIDDEPIDTDYRDAINIFEEIEL